MKSRRKFIQIIPAAPLALMLPSLANAQIAMVPENAPAAVALGYRMNAATVNPAKYPKYIKGAACGNCQLYQAVSPAAGKCLPVGGGVAIGGWCTAWMKRA